MPALQRTTEMLSSASPPQRRALPDGWHVPVCVMMSLGVHVLMTVCMPTAAARELPRRESDLMFMTMSEVMAEAPAPVPLDAPPELQPERPRPEAVVPAAVTPEPEPETDRAPSEPEPSAPPPAASEVMAATSAAAGGPAFTPGTAGGTAHGLGSTPTASETNPAATRPSTGTGTEVDVRGLMRGYMATLNGRVRPEVRYPRAAQIAGLEGTVRIGLLVDQHGNILRRRVQRSSGHPSLDAAALDGAQRVASVPAPPADLRAAWANGPVEITVPIHMTLTR